MPDRPGGYCAAQMRAHLVPPLATLLGVEPERLGVDGVRHMILVPEDVAAGFVRRLIGLLTARLAEDVAPDAAGEVYVASWRTQVPNLPDGAYLPDPATGPLLSPSPTGEADTTITTAAQADAALARIRRIIGITGVRPAVPVGRAEVEEVFVAIDALDNWIYHGGKPPGDWLPIAER